MYEINRDFTDLHSVLPSNILTGKRICVDEGVSVLCDSVLKILSEDLNLTVYSFYRNIPSEHSYPDTIPDGECILVDDMYSCPIKDINNTGVYVYRAQSCEDYYTYDLIIKIKGLHSGHSHFIDGEVEIFNREGYSLHLLYKEKGGRALFSIK